MLDWLINPKVPPALDQLPVVELWPVDIPEVRAGTLLGGASLPLFYTEEVDVIRRWRVQRQSKPVLLYSAIHLNGRLVKAVHLPDLCNCRRCAPQCHGRPPKTVGQGVMYHQEDKDLWCLCCGARG
jgi:hypothetical protein